MIAYLRLEVLRSLRSGGYLAYTIAFPATFYLLFTLIMQAGPMANGTQYEAYFMVSMALYGTIGAGLTSVGSRIALERTKGWTRQLALSPLRPRAYVGVKVATGAMLSVPVIGLIMLAGWLVNDVSLPWYTWLALVPALVVGGLPFAALGIAIGYTFRDEVAQMVSLAVYFVFSMAGGLWMPAMVFPDWLESISHVLPTYQAGELSWRLLAGDQPVSAGTAILAAWTAAFVALAVWRYRRTA
ncbi:ABC-2 type transport system permease protein [Thermocatellispora tengchongensis]|uniref:ABC-2 type transport system permease protein n=1 Tax=Thermocatellispora tengchongensis TaxID=1073253 RepID=A0A840P2P4_9ACTN|nr:ABC transporter permease [Thermocatellispora tengchongensis]MBB5133632.1 ABC-2 type transport system permease protein [Thermocatellispora tengchongensis]